MPLLCAGIPIDEISREVSAAFETAENGVRTRSRKNGVRQARIQVQEELFPRHRHLEIRRTATGALPEYTATVGDVAERT